MYFAWEVYRDRVKVYRKYAVLTVPHKFVRPYPQAFKYAKVRASDADENGRGRGLVVGLAEIEDKDGVRRIIISNALYYLCYRFHYFMPFPYPSLMRDEKCKAEWIQMVSRCGECLWIKGSGGIIHQAFLPRGRSYREHDLREFYCRFFFGKSYKELARFGAFAALRRLGG